MVSAIRCPACQKYQLVEEADRGKSIPCLICKKPIAVPSIRVESPGAPAPNIQPIRLPPMHDRDDVRLEL
jgi:hypothetical protein